MTIVEENGKILLKDCDSFNIGEILECGQCFRFEQLADGEYWLIAFGRVLFARQNGDEVLFWYENGELSISEFEGVWLDYFDLERDYSKIKQSISKNDNIMKEAINYAPGIRLLKQEPWEMLISFIISQNNRITQIKQVIKRISQKYGRHIYGDFYAFPSVDELFLANSEELRELKTGFRDKYILAATAIAKNAQIDLNRANPAETNTLKNQLLEINGIGEKVAHCILLFGYGRYETFPVDTWVRKVVASLYFKNEPQSVKSMHEFAQNKFGKYSGFANQYLFHYIRLNPEKLNIS